MVGRILFSSQGKVYEAILEDDGRWTSTLKLAQRMLNRVFRVPDSVDSLEKRLLAELQKAAVALSGQIAAIDRGE